MKELRKTPIHPLKDEVNPNNLGQYRIAKFLRRRRSKTKTVILMRLMDDEDFIVLSFWEPSNLSSLSHGPVAAAS